jgi:hypothetical protein
MLARNAALLTTGISARFGDMLQDIDANGDGVVVSQSQLSREEGSFPPTNTGHLE